MLPFLIPFGRCFFVLCPFVHFIVWPSVCSCPVCIGWITMEFVHHADWHATLHVQAVLALCSRRQLLQCLPLHPHCFVFSCLTLKDSEKRLSSRIKQRTADSYLSRCWKSLGQVWRSWMWNTSVCVRMSCTCDCLGILTHSDVWLDNSARPGVCAVPVHRPDPRLGQGTHVLFPLCLASEDAPPCLADGCFPGLRHSSASGDRSSGVVLILSVAVLCISHIVTVTVPLNTLVTRTHVAVHVTVSAMMVLWET